MEYTSSNANVPWAAIVEEERSSTRACDSRTARPERRVLVRAAVDHVVTIASRMARERSARRRRPGSAIGWGTTSGPRRLRYEAQSRAHARWCGRADGRIRSRVFANGTTAVARAVRRRGHTSSAARFDCRGKRRAAIASSNSTGAARRWNSWGRGLPARRPPRRKTDGPLPPPHCLCLPPTCPAWFMRLPFIAATGDVKTGRKRSSSSGARAP